MAPPSGSATFKKKDGTLAISKDRKSVSWTPVAPSGAGPQVILEVATITNLQQTPATNPKVMLKIFAQPPGTSEPEAYVFNFTSSSTARTEADAIKDALSNTIQASRADAATPVPTGGSSSAAMAIASALSSGAAGGKSWDDDIRLKADVELQQALMKENPTLQKMFVESLRTKPDSITTSQFTAQFWSSRIHLLRAHAIERTQARGSYNVLSTLEKAKKESGGGDKPKMTLTREQIQLIFQQYPIVKRAYDENVPKMNEIDFWSTFLQSRLLKKVRGEKITESDPTDKYLDKYLNIDDELERAEEVTSAHVPNIIDLEKNEENNSQRKGNQPDFTMRPSSRVPIIRSLNALSEKIMAHVTPVDGDPSAPIGMDEETFNQLQLRDLRGDEEQHRIILNIRDQSRFFADRRDEEEGIDAEFVKQSPKDTLRRLRTELADVESEDGGVDLEQEIGWEDGEDSDEEMDQCGGVGSKLSLSQASAQIIEAIRQRKSQTQHSSSLDSTHMEINTSGLSEEIFERLSLTHATTTEFLHQFWLAFLSGDPERATELASLVESLNRAMDRIKAVADDADAERNKEVEERKKIARETYKRTGRKPKDDYLHHIPGGAKAVNAMMGPTINAVRIATTGYRKALEKETGSLGAET